MLMFRGPHARFLVRALCALAVTLALWWMLLLDPLLEGFRVLTKAALHLLPGDASTADATISPGGDWVLRMPVPSWVARMESTQRLFGRVSPDAPLVKVRSVKVPVEGRFPTMFTVSLPFFWALWAAAPRGRHWVRGALIGTVALAILGALSIILYSVHKASDILHATPTGFAGFLLSTGLFLTGDVIPFAGPVLAALLLNEGLQQFVFEGLAPSPQPVPQRKTAKRRR